MHNPLRDEIDLDEILERQREQRMDRPMGMMPMPTIPMPTPLRRMNVMGGRGIENLRPALMK